MPTVRPAGSKAHPLQAHAWYRALRMMVMLTLGWPMYLTYNAAGRYYERCAAEVHTHVHVQVSKRVVHCAHSPSSSLNVCVWGIPRWASHFDPYSPIFKGRRERVEVVVSDLALAGVLSALAYLGNAYGWLWLVKMYAIPYFIVNHW